MHRISKRYAAFLLAFIPLVLAFFVSCSSAPKTGLFEADDASQEWNAAVDDTIKEPARAAELKKLGQQLIDVSSSIQQGTAGFNEKAMALNENYDATHEELQHLIDELVKTRNAKYAEYRDIIFAMRSQVSADEWKALNK